MQPKLTRQCVRAPMSCAYQIVFLEACVLHFERDTQQRRMNGSCLQQLVVCASAPMGVVQQDERPVTIQDTWRLIQRGLGHTTRISQSVLIVEDFETVDAGYYICTAQNLRGQTSVATTVEFSWLGRRSINELMESPLVYTTSSRVLLTSALPEADVKRQTPGPALWVRPRPPN